MVFFHGVRFLSGMKMRRSKTCRAAEKELCLFLNVLLDDLAEDGHTGLDLLLVQLGVVQSDAVVVSFIREEAVAGDIGNIAGQALLGHFIGVDIIR